MSNSSTLITPLLPQCSGGITSADFNPDDALKYQPNTWDYYKSIIPSTIPGIVLGALSLLGFIIFVIWILVQYCVCCHRGCSKSSTHDDQEMDQQFIKQEGSYGNQAFGLPSPSQKERSRCSCTKIMQILIIVFTLATIALSGYGIAVSIENTDDQITNFWVLVDNVNKKVNDTTTTLTNLSSEMLGLENSLDTVSKSSASLSGVAGPAATSLGLNADEVQKGLNSLDKATAIIASARKALDEAVNTVEENIGKAVDNIQDQFKPPSLTFENKGRLIAIAVLFSLTLISSFFAGFLSLRVLHPIWASFFTALLWLCVALLMILGVALLQGVKYVSSDSCLYAETFAFDYVMNKVKDEQKRDWIVAALRYYFVPTPPVDEPPSSALSLISGIDMAPIYNILLGPEFGNLTALISDPSIASQLGGIVDAGTVSAVQEIAKVAPAAIQSLTDLDNEASRKSVFPLYQEFKTYICCNISSSADKLFIAWTVVGCVGFVLSLLCSWRIVRHTFKKKKRY